MRYQQRLLELQKQETENRIRQSTEDIDLEEQLGLVAEEKLTLLTAKLDRAEKLRASQTISSEALIQQNQPFWQPVSKSCTETVRSHSFAHNAILPY